MRKDYKLPEKQYQKFFPPAFLVNGSPVFYGMWVVMVMRGFSTGRELLILYCGERTYISIRKSFRLFL